MEKINESNLLEEEANAVQVEWIVTPQYTEIM